MDREIVACLRTKVASLENEPIAYHKRYANAPIFDHVQLKILESSRNS